MSASSIPKFLHFLTRPVSPDGVFNPWVDVDRENDIGPHCPQIRRKHFRRYLGSRQNTAKYVIIGEAVGYQGGHFSGIPMTSERILLGFQKERGIYPEHVLLDLKPQRTSKPDKMPRGFTEPTATIVWETVLRLHLRPTDFVLWNAFAWHPFDPRKGMLSNRRPKAKEMIDACQILERFVQLFPGATFIAMGRVAMEWLGKMAVDCHPVRHPAQGGAKAFRIQLSKIVGKKQRA